MFRFIFGCKHEQSSRQKVVPSWNVEEHVVGNSGGNLRFFLLEVVVGPSGSEKAPEGLHIRSMLCSTQGPSQFCCRQQHLRHMSRVSRTAKLLQLQKQTIIEDTTLYEGRGCLDL